MAVIDYGAIVFQNGECMNDSMYHTPLSSTIPSNILDNIPENTKRYFKNNTFITVGNENVLIGFYKEQIVWWIRGEEINREFLNCSDYFGWNLWSKTLILPEGSSQTFLTINTFPVKDYYVAKFKIDGDNYTVVFGCGVDYNYWRRTGRVNYYHSFKYRFSKLRYKLFRQ